MTTIQEKMEMTSGVAPEVARGTKMQATSDDLDQIKPFTGSGVHCVICLRELDVKVARRKGGVTCPSTDSDCTAKYRQQRRKLIESTRTRCRSCGAPSNPAERELFKQWRKSQAAPRGRKKKVADVCASPDYVPGQEGIASGHDEPAASSLRISEVYGEMEIK